MDIEKMILARGLTAPRVTPADLQARSMFKVMTLKRWRQERQQMRLAMLVAIKALSQAQVPMDGGHAKVLAQGFSLVRREGDPDLGFDEKKQTAASRIMSLDQARASGMIRGR